MNSNKAYKICMAIIIFVITFIMSSTCYADTQRITNDFEISSNSVNLDEVTYGCSEEKNGKTISLLVSAYFLHFSIIASFNSFSSILSSLKFKTNNRSRTSMKIISNFRFLSSAL